MIIIGFDPIAMSLIARLKQYGYPSAVLVLAGSEEQLARYEDFVGKASLPDAPMLILGGAGSGRRSPRPFLKEG